jgi:gamma-glutamyltranspeptidase/glutathione hydrolase
MFYEGEIAHRIAAFSERVGGLLRLEDLQRYQAGFEVPIRTTFAGYEICTQSTWTQAAVLLQSLNMLEHIDIRTLGHNSPAYIHTMLLR